MRVAPMAAVARGAIRRPRGWHFSWILVRRLVLLRRTWKSWPLFRVRCRTQSVGHNRLEPQKNAMIAFLRYFRLRYFYTDSFFPFFFKYISLKSTFHFRPVRMYEEKFFVFFSSVKFKVFQKIEILPPFMETQLRFAIGWMKQKFASSIFEFSSKRLVFFFSLSLSPFFPPHIFKSRKMEIFKFL